MSVKSNLQGTAVGGAAKKQSDPLKHARRLARHLDYQTSHDSVTGLVNRAEFLRRAEALVADSSAGGPPHAMLYLDLDQFRVINGTSGHDAGDELLRQVATVLLPQLRDTDLLGRLGGDEFGVLLRKCTLVHAESLAEKLIECIRQHSFRWQDSLHTISASAGVAMLASETSAQRALACADTACFLAKERGRGRVQAYQPEDRDLARYRLEMGWVSRIAAALGEDRFRLRFQPISPLRDGEHEEHIEALLYLLDETGEPISPASFISAAERYNLMPAVDRWVVSHALGRLARHLAEERRVVLCVNLSAMTLCDDDFPDYVRTQFAATGVAPHRICFEITETAATANPPQTIAVIDRLKSLGCHFALDDFGQGLSSFGYLRTLRVDYLKIDGAFVRGIATSAADRAIVTAMNDVGHVIGLKTIAECVETEEVLQELRKIGVDYVQGYWISRPQADFACTVSPRNDGPASHSSASSCEPSKSESVSHDC